jgi:hypothetical protein
MYYDMKICFGIERLAVLALGTWMLYSRTFVSRIRNGIIASTLLTAVLSRDMLKYV